MADKQETSKEKPQRQKTVSDQDKAKPSWSKTYEGYKQRAKDTQAAAVKWFTDLPPAARTAMFMSFGALAGGGAGAAIGGKGNRTLGALTGALGGAAVAGAAGPISDLISKAISNRDVPTSVWKPALTRPLTLTGASMMLASPFIYRLSIPSMRRIDSLLTGISGSRGISPELLTRIRHPTAGHNLSLLQRVQDQMHRDAQTVGEYQRAQNAALEARGFVGDMTRREAARLKNAGREELLREVFAANVADKGNNPLNWYRRLWLNPRTAKTLGIGLGAAGAALSLSSVAYNAYKNHKKIQNARVGEW